VTPKRPAVSPVAFWYCQSTMNSGTDNNTTTSPVRSDSCHFVSSNFQASTATAAKQMANPPCRPPARNNANIALTTVA
jgi:hypothetical protein